MLQAHNSLLYKCSLMTYADTTSDQFSRKKGLEQRLHFYLISVADRHHPLIESDYSNFFIVADVKTIYTESIRELMKSTYKVLPALLRRYIVIVM